MSSPRRVRLRRERHDSSTATTSLLSVPGAVGLEVVGFEPVGDVMGATSARIPPENIGYCDYRSRLSTQPPPGIRASSRSRSLTYARALREAYARMLGRVVREAEAMHADGVVDIRIDVEIGDEDVYAMVATGTAVRARSMRRPDHPFTTDLTGSDVAKLMLGGWAPVRLHVIAGVGLRHDDVETMRQAGRTLRNWNNNEVAGYSELTRQVTTQAREKFAVQVAAGGGEGALLSDLDIASSYQRCRVQGVATDHIVRAIVTGTSIVRFAGSRHVSPQPLTIMPVGDATRRAGATS